MQLSLPPPLRVSEEGSFAHYTLVNRLPAIVERVISENDFPSIIAKDLRVLRDELPNGLVRPLKDDGGPDVAAWADYVELYMGQRWLDLPWYFAEAYFYRRLLEATRYFSPGPWQGIDPFKTQKHAGLETAMRAVRALSDQLNRFLDNDGDIDQAGLATLIHLGLWGNRADLSLRPTEDVEGRDRSHVQVEDERANILVDDTPALVNKIAGLRGARIDFIVDNAGFELFCDLCLADFLLASEVAGAVQLHLKAHPTFVSDAIVSDVQRALKVLAADRDPEVRALADRLRDYVDSRRLQLRDHLFWTAPLAFWEMPDDVHQDLGRADLIFVKGDANYRRLLGDRHWPFTTPFEDIVCYFPGPLAALRTLKSELAAGLQPGTPETLSQEDPDWLINGRWGVIQVVDSLEPD